MVLLLHSYSTMIWHNCIVAKVEYSVFAWQSENMITHDGTWLTTPPLMTSSWSTGTRSGKFVQKITVFDTLPLILCKILFPIRFWGFLTPDENSSVNLSLSHRFITIGIVTLWICWVVSKNYPNIVKYQFYKGRILPGAISNRKF